VAQESHQDLERGQVERPDILTLPDPFFQLVASPGEECERRPKRKWGTPKLGWVEFLLGYFMSHSTVPGLHDRTVIMIISPI
jgi:hypothetical protein